MEEQRFYAKSPLADGRQITVSEHLRSVSALARMYGAEIGMEGAAALSGVEHDVGKYGELFQDVLQHKAKSIDHAIVGAVMLYIQIGLLARKKGFNRGEYEAVAAAIAGHHDGLIDYTWLEEKLRQCLEAERPVVTRSGKEAAVTGIAAYRQIDARFKAEFPEYCWPRLARFLPENVEQEKLAQMLRTRMLFSCLVDADYSASAMDEDPQYLERTQDDAFDADALLHALQTKRDAIRAASTARSGLNALRDELFDRCGQAGEGEPGLYSLTAPTGTGKTLAMLHFALRHCRRWGKRRVIVVLPFLTLTEQSAAAYREIVPNVFEDHSLAEPGDDAREFASRWRVPFIVTTSVRFFESLFAWKPSDCRKLHNIANSVILFDEVQSLPAGLLATTLHASRELCERYSCTMLFSSATQPAFDALPLMRWPATEVMPDHGKLYRALRRTRVDWRLDKATPLGAVAREMSTRQSVCAVVNLRRHAARLYEQLRERCGETGTFFLTTDLCPAHRGKLIRAIRTRLNVGLPCRVVATQCIEAGVDLDFDCVYRAIAPLDAIIQTAGRCNRNGRLEMGEVIVFEPDEEGELYPSNWYRRAANIVKGMHFERVIDIHDPQDIRRYYELLFACEKDDRELLDAIAQKDFEAVGDAYRLIRNSGTRVIVPCPGKEALYEEIYAEYARDGLSAALLRRAAPIAVSTYEDVTTIAERMAYPARRGAVPEESDTAILRRQYAALYLPDMGLQLRKTADQKEKTGKDDKGFVF